MKHGLYQGAGANIRIIMVNASSYPQASLTAQWLGLHTSTARDTVQSLLGELRSHVCALWYGQNNNNKEKHLKKKKEGILEIGIQGNLTFNHVTGSVTKEFPCHDKEIDFQSVESKEQRKGLLLVSKEFAFLFKTIKANARASPHSSPQIFSFYDLILSKGVIMIILVF